MGADGLTAGDYTTAAGEHGLAEHEPWVEELMAELGRGDMAPYERLVAIKARYDRQLVPAQPEHPTGDRRSRAMSASPTLVGV